MLQKNKKFPKIKKKIANFLSEESWEITKSNFLGMSVWAWLLTVSDQVNATNFWPSYWLNCSYCSVQELNVTAQHTSACHWNVPFVKWHFSGATTDTNVVNLVWTHNSHWSHWSHWSHCSCC